VSDFQTDVAIRLGIGILTGCTLVALLYLGPLFMIMTGAIGVTLGLQWWRAQGKFNNLKLADQRTIIEWKKLLGEWIKWFEIERKYIHAKMLYLGDSADGTIRYWYDSGYYVPQAVDNGEFYWERKVWIENATLREKLNGFQEMGNEWPAYYQEVVLANKRKKKIKEQEVKARKENRQINQKSAASAFMDSHPDTLLDMKQTVEELRKEIEGYCPVINFEEIQ